MLKAAWTFPALAVEKEFDLPCLVHGKVEALISDNGPEFPAMTLHEGVANSFIQHGEPSQNGYIASFFGKLGDELLS